MEFVKKFRFGNNTTIVIVGDYLSTECDFVPQDSYRYIYNTFINPHFSANPSFELTKNRSGLLAIIARFTLHFVITRQ